MNKIFKKLVSTAAIATTLLTVPMSAGAASHYQYGDIDHDGCIDSADASQAMQLHGQEVSFRNGKPVKNKVYYADVNGDGIVTSEDSGMILEYYANLGGQINPLGDANGDGNVNVGDVIIVNRWNSSANKHTSNNDITINLINANVDRNSVVDNNDSDLIMDYILDIISEF